MASIENSSFDHKYAFPKRNLGANERNTSNLNDTDIYSTKKSENHRSWQTQEALMCLEFNRLATFKKFPNNARTSAIYLAREGFYYIGCRDRVQCFSCNCTLENWERNSKSYVQERHLCQSPKCLMANKMPTSGNVLMGQTSYVPNNTKVNPGPPAPIVNTKETSQAQTNNTVQNDRPSDNQAPTRKEVKDSILPIKVELEAKTLSPNTPTRPEDKRSLQSLKEENSKLQESRICKICLDKHINCVILPCGHLCSCYDCTNSIAKCPICRGQIRGTVKMIN